MSPTLYRLISWLQLCQVAFGLTVSSETVIRDSASPGSTVTIGGATYIGFTNTTYNVENWLGIPYAEPPTGSLRLRPPQPFMSTGSVNAQAFGYACFQMLPPGSSLASLPQSEDCLTLNIFKPSGLSPRKRLPVLFWIHGGGFSSGSGIRYSPQSMVNLSAELQNPVVIVSINYRLNFFGFPAGTTAVAHNATNLGLLDQRQALRWVRDNIGAFGGDPDKVTIWGESAGATSVGLQMTAYNGTGENLFRSAILESGAPDNNTPTPLPTWPAYQSLWDTVVSALGCQNATDAFACVQSIPEKTIFATINAVGRSVDPLTTGSYSWQPVVDGAFIADFPSKLIAAKKAAKIPIILGSTTDELTTIVPTYYNISSDTILIGLGQTLLPFVPLSIVVKTVSLDTLAEYPDIGVGGTEWRRATAIVSDIYQRCPSRAFAQNQTENGVWKYRWNAILPSDFAKAPYLGVYHGADLAYVFGQSNQAAVMPPQDLALSRTVQQAWISFAARGDPNALGDLAPGLKWPRYHKIDDQALVFQKPNGTQSVAGQGLFIENDPDDRPICSFITANSAAFVR